MDEPHEDGQSDAVTYTIRVALEGSEDAVRSRLDALLGVLHEFALLIDALPRGAALKAGRVVGMFDETRWSALCKRLRAGTTSYACIDRNSYLPEAGLFSATHEWGLTQVSCSLCVGDDLMGTSIDMDFSSGDDAVLSADDFRGWVDRIEEVSGMRRTSFTEREVIFEVFDGNWHGFDMTGVFDLDDVDLEALVSMPQPSEVNGVGITGWEKVQEEMEVIILPAVALSLDNRALIEQTLKGWGEHGTDVGYGEGTFHGWIPGEWESGRYYFRVNSGAQLVDWHAAISDLADRLGELRAAGVSLRIELGPETE